VRRYRTKAHYRLVNGEAESPDGGDNTDGIEQLLDLVHIIILALVKHAPWLPGALNQGSFVY
jgi:hypothetical protein